MAEQRIFPLKNNTEFTKIHPLLLELSSFEEVISWLLLLV